MQTITRHRSTVEYLSYTFEDFTDEQGQQATPPSNYQMAAVPATTTPAPSDYHDAPWLAGPMEPGDYDVYLRFTDNPEVPVTYVAQLHVQ